MYIHNTCIITFNVYSEFMLYEGCSLIIVIEIFSPKPVSTLMTLQIPTSACPTYIIVVDFKWLEDFILAESSLPC